MTVMQNVNDSAQTLIRIGERPRGRRLKTKDTFNANSIINTQNMKPVYFVIYVFQALQDGGMPFIKLCYAGK
jgi:hypothetical protein